MVINLVIFGSGFFCGFLICALMAANGKDNDDE